jgi:hypothetical protein
MLIAFAGAFSTDFVGVAIDASAMDTGAGSRVDTPCVATTQAIARINKPMAAAT